MQYVALMLRMLLITFDIICSFLLQITEDYIPDLEIFANLSDYQIYTTINAQNQLRARFSYGISLRPHTYDGATGREIKSIVFETSDYREIFLTVMRLAKVS